MGRVAAMRVPLNVIVEGEVQAVSIDRVIQERLSDPESGVRRTIQEDVKLFLSDEELKSAYDRFLRAVEYALKGKLDGG